MKRYSKPIWEMVKEAVTELRVADTNEVIEYIHQKYPDDKVKIGPIRSHMIACAINHPSAIHHRTKHRFLFQLDDKKYELYNPHKHGNWIIGAEGPYRIDGGSDGKENPNPPFSKLSHSNYIKLPDSIVEKLDLKVDDIVVFVVKDEEILLKKGSLSIQVL